MIEKIALGIAALALIVSGVAIYSPEEPSGGNTSYTQQSFLEGFYAGAGRDVEVNRDGDLIFNPSSFCIDFYATSTDTRLNMTASSTATVSGQQTEAGVMLFDYGSCQ